MRRKGFLKARGALHLLVLLPHLAGLAAAPEGELRHDREVQVERAGAEIPFPELHTSDVSAAAAPPS